MKETVCGRSPRDTVPQIIDDGTYLLLGAHAELPPQSDVWDMLWTPQSPGRISLAVLPNPERIQRLRDTYQFVLPSAAPSPQQWHQGLLDGLFHMAACMQLPGDYCPGLTVPRAVHGQSQGIVDLFGATAELCADGNYFPHPLPPDPEVITSIEPAPVQSSHYWHAVEWIAYARQATGGVVPFRNAVMVGPFDLAAYLLGSSVLMEWVYTESETLHHLLKDATSVISNFLAAMNEAAEGAICSHHTLTMRGGFDLCSETRSLISLAIYEDFDAPYLRLIGERIGAFGVHSCGNWERTISSVLRDGCIRVMHGQSKENDLHTLCQLANGRLALAIAPSANLHERYLWPNFTAYMHHVLEVVPDSQPFELRISEDDLPQFLALHREIRGHDFLLLPPLWHCQA